MFSGSDVIIDCVEIGGGTRASFEWIYCIIEVKIGRHVCDLLFALPDFVKRRFELFQFENEKDEVNQLNIEW